MTIKRNEVEALSTIRSIMLEHGHGVVPVRFSKATKAIASVHIQTRMSTAGRGVWIPKELAFSRRWALVLPERELWEVVIHEIAHIRTLEAKRPHGPEFKREVRSLGGMATERCFLPSVHIDGTPRN